MKTLAKIVTIILVVFIVFLAIISFIHTPVATEGKKLNVAQKAVVWIKSKLYVLLTGAGITLDGALFWLLAAVSKSSQIAASVTSNSDKVICELKKDIGVLKEKRDFIVEKKQDCIMELFSTVFLASDMPADVRSKVLLLKDEYESIVSDAKVVVEQVKTIEKEVESVTESTPAEEPIVVEAAEPVARF